MARIVKTYSLSVLGSYDENRCEIRTDHGRRAKELQITNFSDEDLQIRINEDDESVFTLPANYTQLLQNLSVSIVELQHVASGGVTPSDVEVICFV